MMTDVEISFPAFMLSGLAAFALGVLWYHPNVFGTRWMAARGVDPKEAKPNALPFIASFFLWILSACFYSFLADFTGINTAAGYFCLSCLLWVAFSMPPLLMGSLYTGYPFDAVAIDASYQLGGYYVFALVHMAFL